VSAENNLAERDLRPTVIASKVSFGSQSDARAHTCGILMSILHTLKKSQVDVVGHLKEVLAQLAKISIKICSHRSSLAVPPD
jgi:transposase